MIVSSNPVNVRGEFFIVNKICVMLTKLKFVVCCSRGDDIQQFTIEPCSIEPRNFWGSLAGQWVCKRSHSYSECELLLFSKYFHKIFIESNIELYLAFHSISGFHSQILFTISNTLFRVRAEVDGSELLVTKNSQIMKFSL